MDIAPLTASLVPPTDGMVIREDTRLEPGVYVIPDGIVIAADNVTLDGNGATLVGRNRLGVGVSVNGHKNVTIRNLRIRDYYHGIVARETESLRIEHNEITSTAEVEANTVFLNIWTPASQAYGGAILLDSVTDAEINDNDLQHQMHGLMTFGCRRLSVRRNVASYNSSAGFHLYGTSDSTFEENWADYCIRYEPRDRGTTLVGAGSAGHMGADASGFVIVHRSCHNVFRRNFARMGGDGFFLAGRTASGDDVGCNNNLFEENDASLSPNIAFEATFCTGNVYRNNWADRCNFGFWLGYSMKNVIEGNRMLFNRQAGIAVEHGVEFEVRNNDFQSNGFGILLWTNYVREFFDSYANRRTIRNWQIEHNKFYRNGTAVAIMADRDHGLRASFDPNRGRPELRPRDCAIRHNDIQDNRVGIHLDNTDRITIEKNKLSKNVEADLRRDDDRETDLGHNLGRLGAYL